MGTKGLAVPLSDWIEEGRENQRRIRDFCWKNAICDQEAGGNGAEDEFHVGHNGLAVQAERWALT